MSGSPADPPGGARGEETGAGATTAQADLVAALAVAGLAVVAMVLALQLPSPGRTYSAPGLVPVATGASLLLMAIGLGVAAVRRGALVGSARDFVDGVRATPERRPGRRTLGLVALLGLYVVLLDLVSFDLHYRLAGLDLRLSSFEAVSIPSLAAILRGFWRRPLVRCALVAAVASVSLAAIFRYGFRILLPGLD